MSSAVCIVVVDFHHALGNRVEWSHPPLEEALAGCGVADTAAATELLPFFALPDGAHLSDVGRALFALRLPPLLLYGAACYAQLPTAELPAEAHATRSHVQKAACVLFRGSPCFARVFPQLSAAAAAWTAQRDFAQRRVLEDCFASLQASLHAASRGAAAQLTASFVERSVSDTLRGAGGGARNVLALFKLVLAGARVVVAACGRAHCAQDAGEVVLLVSSLVPLLLQSPPFTTTQGAVAVPSERQRAFGFPLRVGGSGVWSPLATVQQADSLARQPEEPFFVGATNALFLPGNNAARADAVFDCVSGGLSLLTPAGAALGQLTAADKRFADALLPADHDDDSGEWMGGDDWIRAQFAEYLERLVCCAAVAEEASPPQQQDARSMLHEFGREWVGALLRSKVIVVRPESAAELKSLIPAEHPGGPSPLQELGRQIGEQQERVRQTVKPYAQKVGTALSGAASSMGRAIQDAAHQAQHAIQQRRASASAPSATSEEVSEVGMLQEEEPHPAQSWLSRVANSQIVASVRSTGRNIAANFSELVNPQQQQQPQQQPDAAKE